MKKKKVRELAAVMFADIVGYSSLMQRDEQAAAVIRDRHREVFQHQHGLHEGKIIQYYGDGVLSVFKSAVKAAECAIAIQRLLQEGNPVPLRIGLHMGDIVFDETEVYGDGVNVASRIEGLGISGSVLLSGKLNDELRNHTTISTTSLGKFSLKNIEVPIEVFAITNEGMTIPPPAALKHRQHARPKTIAVLPFINMSASSENEYFSDGITEEIINALCKIKSLRVTSRTSSFFFKNKHIPVRQIGSELNVSTVLEGSVRLSRNMLRITAQLIDVENDFHFWSESWDRKPEKIFEIQDEISLLIAEKLREFLGHFEIQEHLVQKQTDNYSAYELYLKGRYYFRKWNPADINTAISYYNEALQADPQHAQSVLGLADCYSFLGNTGFIPFAEGWSKSAALTHKGLALNDQLADGHYQLASLQFFTKCDYAAALQATWKAVEINPNYVEAQQYLSFLYIIAGKKEKAQQHLQTARAIDPLSQETLFFSAYFDYMTEDYPGALSKLDQCLEVNPRNIPAHSVKCYCLLRAGQYDTVLNYFSHYPSEIFIPEETRGLKTLAFALKKDHDQAMKGLEELKILANTPAGFRTGTLLFLLYAVMGEKDKAFACIETAIHNKWPLLLIHFVDPLADGLKSDRRYIQYQKQIFGGNERAESEKIQKPLLDETEVTYYTARLNQHMRESRPYLRPDLSLKMLAEQISIHPNALSWLLNEQIGKSFNDFIHDYRIDAQSVMEPELEKNTTKLL